MRPGGQAYVGGGLGDPAMRAELERRRNRLHPEWGTKNRRPPQRADREYIDALQSAGIDLFRIDRGDDGLWITFRREMA